MTLAAAASAGCSSAPLAGGAERDAAPEGAETARRPRAPGSKLADQDQTPGEDVVSPAKDDGAKVPANPGDTASDPYRKTPGGERPADGSEQPPARFAPPRPELVPARRSVRLPASLAVAFVRAGRCASEPKAVLELEGLLAREEALRSVVALPPPRGGQIDLLGLGRRARDAGADLLLVVLRPEGERAPRRAYLLCTQERAAEPVLLARLEAPARRPETQAPTQEPATQDASADAAGVEAPAGQGLGLELVLQSVARAHRRMTQ
ncbi:MAG: hypothetical protein AB7N76_12165 [Planctomycetota bacterium]